MTRSVAALAWIANRAFNRWRKHANVVVGRLEATQNAKLQQVEQEIALVKVGSFNKSATLGLGADSVGENDTAQTRVPKASTTQIGRHQVALRELRRGKVGSGMRWHAYH